MGNVGGRERNGPWNNAVGKGKMNNGYDSWRMGEGRLGDDGSQGFASSPLESKNDKGDCYCLLSAV